MVRYFVTAACVALGLTGCGTVQERDVPVPEPVVITVDCTTELPDWLFEPLQVPWMPDVREAGGTNRALLQMFNVSRLLLESANIRLAKIQELQRDAIERCRAD